MNKAPRVAVAGAGYFAQFHLEAWKQLEREGVVELVALADPDDTKSAAAASRHDVPRRFADAAQMLDALAPDLFDIVTPPATHLPLIQLAARRGIACISQKPLAPTYGEAVELVEVAKRAGIELIVHENFRWMPWYREMRRCLDDGMLGTPHTISVRMRPGDGQGPEAYLRRQPYFQIMPRLLIHETAIHYIDSFRFLLGEITHVTARLRRMNPAIAGEDAGYLIFEFSDGATGLFDGNRLNDHVAADPRRTMGEMWLEGSGGVLRVDGDARMWWKPHHAEEHEHTYDRGTATFGGGCCAALQRHVIAHMTRGSAVENCAADYLVNLKVQEAAYESHASGRRIALAGYDPPRTAAPFETKRAATSRA